MESTIDISQTALDQLIAEKHLTYDIEMSLPLPCSNGKYRAFLYFQTYTEEKFDASSPIAVFDINAENAGVENYTSIDTDGKSYVYESRNYDEAEHVFNDLLESLDDVRDVFWSRTAPSESDRKNMGILKECFYASVPSCYVPFYTKYCHDFLSWLENGE